MSLEWTEALDPIVSRQLTAWWEGEALDWRIQIDIANKDSVSEVSWWCNYKPHGSIKWTKRSRGNVANTIAGSDAERSLIEMFKREAEDLIKAADEAKAAKRRAFDEINRKPLEWGKPPEHADHDGWEGGEWIGKRGVYRYAARTEPRVLASVNGIGIATHGVWSIPMDTSAPKHGLSTDLVVVTLEGTGLEVATRIMDAAKASDAAIKRMTEESMRNHDDACQ